jgi:hypothetical protein
MEAKLIENEIKTVTKFSTKGAQLHIVKILKVGELHQTQHVFIDMELCDLNLDECIYCTRTRISVLTYWREGGHRRRWFDRTKVDS